MSDNQGGLSPWKRSISFVLRIRNEKPCAKTVENIRQRLVTEGFEATLCGKPRETPSRPPVFDGEQEAKVIALRLGPAPKGFANWSLRLLAEKVVELGIVESVSHETVRRTLKKTA